jgi:hypothetical protein
LAGPQCRLCGDAGRGRQRFRSLIAPAGCARSCTSRRSAAWATTTPSSGVA